MPDFASTIGIMIGLGVGIDYALFIVTRFRENLHKGHSVEASTLVAMDTAGRAVLFAGTTVVISLMGMLIMQLSFVSGLAIGAAVVVAMTLLASLTLLPALLGFAGERVEVTRWRGLIAAGLIAVALIGAGLGVPALIAGHAAGRRRRAAGQLRRRPAAQAGAGARAASRCGRRSPTAGAGSSSTARGPPSSSAPPSSCSSPCRSSGCASASPTRATTPRTPPPARPTTCWPRASVPGFNGAARAWPPRCPTGTDPAALQAVSDAIAGRPGRRARSARRSPTTRRPRRRPCGG